MLTENLVPVLTVPCAPRAGAAAPPQDAGQAFGRIRHNKLVYFDGDGGALKGQLVNVRIDRCNAYSLFGELVEVLPSSHPLPWAAAAAGKQAVAV